MGLRPAASQVGSPFPGGLPPAICYVSASPFGKEHISVSAHFILHLSTIPPALSINATYQSFAACNWPFSVVNPQITVSVRVVRGVVLVRWESLTGFAQGPSWSWTHNSPVTSISCPDALKIYRSPELAGLIESGASTRSRSMTLMGNPLCRDTILQTSTAILMELSRPESAALTRYSEAGFPRPVGLYPLWRSKSRMAVRNGSDRDTGASASRLNKAIESGGKARSSMGDVKVEENTSTFKRGYGSTSIINTFFPSHR